MGTKSKKIALIMCMIMVASSILVACGGPKQSAASNEEKVAKFVSDEPYEFKLPLVDEPVEITWATHDNWYAPASYSDGLPVWKEIQEKTGITINWEALSGGEYETSMQTRLAAAKNLPDILRVPGGDPTQYGQQGLLLPLNSLIDKYGVHIKEVFEQYPLAGKLMRSGDGNYYGIAPVIKESSRWNPNYFVVRKDWVDRLDLKWPPETLDDWIVMLKAFRDQDANGNGDSKDEIPWGADPSFFGEAFGLHLWTSCWYGGLYTDENGKVYYQYTDPKYKEYLEFAHMLYEEGLLDPDYGNPSAEDQQAKVTKDLVGSLNMFGDLALAWGDLMRSSNVPGAIFAPTPPPKGPHGDQSMEGFGTVDMGFQGISKDCERPDVALKLFDYIFSEEGKNYMAYGIEGETYEYVDGKPTYTDKVMNNEEGLGPVDVLRSYGSWPTTPWVQLEYSYVQQLEQDEYFKDAAQTCVQPFYVEPFPLLLASQEEKDKLSILQTDLQTYRSEQVTKFIMGQRPLEEFDDYVNELKGMGLDEFVSIKQEQWDRTMNEE